MNDPKDPDDLVERVLEELDIIIEKAKDFLRKKGETEDV